MEKEKRKRNKLECRVLSCKKDIDEAVVAISSLKQFMDIEVFVHDDGTMTGKDYLKIKEIPAHIVTPLQADKEIAYSSIAEKRLLALEKFPLLRKCIDIPLMAKSDEILMMDSDCFFFKKPTELINAMKTHYYIYSPAKSFSYGNAKSMLLPPTRLDTKPGSFLMVYPPKFYQRNLNLLDTFLTWLLTHEVNHCDEQGFFHITLSGNYLPYPLDEYDYVTTSGFDVGTNAVMIHTTNHHGLKKPICSRCRESLKRG